MVRRLASTAFALGLLACGAAASGEPGAAERLVVFPLEGVNVPASTARAATELLASSLRARGVDVADPGAAAPYAAPTPAGAPPPAPPEAAGPQLVDHATPPPAPGMTAFVGDPGAPAGEGAPPVPSAEEKAGIARGLGCGRWADGRLVRLGSEIRVTVSLRDASGAGIDERSAAVRSDDGLAAAIDVIARALTGDPAAVAALQRNAAGKKRPGPQPGRRVQVSLGAAIGGLFGVADTLDTGMMAGFDGRFERGRLLVIVNAGVGISSPDRYDDWADSEDDHYGDFDADYTYYDPDEGWNLSTGDEPGFQVWLSVDLAGYLLRSGVSPYLGAGVGAFVGGRVHVEERVDLDGNAANGDDATKFWDSKVGLDLHPTLGIEFLRRGPIRLHLEGRYSCNFSAGGSFGHGPIALAGVNF